MSTNKPIIIVAGEPNSIFLEIFFKSLKKIKTKNPLILIASLNLVRLQMRKLKYKKKINLINLDELLNNSMNKSLDNKKINLIDVKYKQKKAFENISKKSNQYIKNCFEVAFKILKKKYLGVTEYISSRFKVKKYSMLIYNEKLAVCPITTHLPLKNVPKRINSNLIFENIKLIDKFYKTKLNIKPKIAILGLNPHCESILKFNEDEKILKPAIKSLKKSGINISGPFPSDTMFLKKNRKKYKVIVGMYHDQVLTPIKTLFEYDAFNITLGLPFLRVSPDHGPNESMLGKNLSNPLSLIKTIKFLDKN